MNWFGTRRDFYHGAQVFIYCASLGLSGCGTRFEAANYSSQSTSASSTSGASNNSGSGNSGQNQGTQTCASDFNLQNGKCVPNVCTPKASQACQTGNGIGSQTCNSSGSAWGQCANLTSCNSGFNLQSGACVANVCSPNSSQSCQVGNGTGSQTCNSSGSAWDQCGNITSCNSGYNLQSGACVANVCTPNSTKSCQVGNGTGSQTCNSSGSAWGPCGNLTSCNSGYNLQSGACVANVCSPNSSQSCQVGNGTGSQTCNSTGSAWGQCANLTSCNSGYNLQFGTCVANVCSPNSTQSCQVGNGTGSQTCNSSGSAWGQCGNITSCNSGYNLQGGACVTNVCSPNSTQSCQSGISFGSQTCNSSGSAWGQCGNFSRCIAGYNFQNGNCVPNICVPNTSQACEINNGNGSRTCNSTGSAWGACGNLTSCYYGYNLQNGGCVRNVCNPYWPQDCQGENGSGSQTCNSSGSGWGSCLLTTCNSGFNLQNGTCVSNTCTPNSTQACRMGNGTGSQTCNGNGSGWSQCDNITSCDWGYTLQNGACVAACIFGGTTVASGRYISGYTVSAAPSGHSCAEYAVPLVCSSGSLYNAQSMQNLGTNVTAYSPTCSDPGDMPCYRGNYQVSSGAAFYDFGAVGTYPYEMMFNCPNGYSCSTPPNQQFADYSGTCANGSGLPPDVGAIGQTISLQTTETLYYSAYDSYHSSGMGALTQVWFTSPTPNTSTSVTVTLDNMNSPGTFQQIPAGSCVVGPSSIYTSPGGKNTDSYVIPNGATALLFDGFAQGCNAQPVTCANGSLAGDLSYMLSTCSP